jgi:hypothetical protein
MYREWALLRIGRAHRPTSAVETLGSLYLDPSPIVFFYDGEPGAAPVIHLIAPRRVKSRKREEHRPIGGVINQEMEDDGATKTAYISNGPGNLEVFGEVESQLIVDTVEIGAHYSRSADAATHPLTADNNPTVDRGDKETLVEFSANGPLQHSGRDDL